MAKLSALSSCMVVQELDKEYWQGLYEGVEDAAMIAKIDRALDEVSINDNIKPLMQLISNNLIAADMFYTVMYGIIHKSDTRKIWDEQTLTEIVEVKPKHIHIAIQFEARKDNQTTFSIAQCCGVQEQYIEKPHSGRYSWDNMCAYLIHAKDSEKYQYSPDDVVTLAKNNRVPNYKTLYMQQIDTWHKGAATKRKAQAALSVDWLREQISEGNITKEAILLTDEYYKIYRSRKRECDEEFELYTERKIMRAVKALESGEYKLTVYYITGRSGNGKTRFAKEFIGHLMDISAAEFGEKWSCCSTAASNPVDDYAGQEILFMDDLRGAAMSASDWLKLLDPYNTTPSSARYKNRTVAARVIVITSEKNPLDFFYYTKGIGGDKSEAMDQFIRRICSVMTVINADDDYSRLLIRKADVVKSSTPKTVEIPSTKNDSAPYPFDAQRVTMHYDFTGYEELDKDDCIRAMTDTVIDNNNNVIAAK